MAVLLLSGYRSGFFHWTICDEAQTKILALVSVVNSTVAIYARQTRDLLLPKLISGEIDVSELDIETGDIDDR